MNPKYKLSLQLSAIVLLLILTSFVTVKFRDWIPPRQKIEIVFEDCRFPANGTMPWIRPIKDLTKIKILRGDLTGRKFGETITPQEVDEAIEKLIKEKK